MSDSILHITNGDSAVERLRDAAVPGTLLPWRDVLHEGPVPADLPLEQLSRVRAQFLARCGLGDYRRTLMDLRQRDAVLATAHRRREVVLWFEHDLYDQIQLLQLLDWFAAHGTTGRLTLVFTEEYLGQLDPAACAGLFESRRDVSTQQLGLGRAAWTAFRAPEPDAVEQIATQDTSCLPHLAQALRRHLQEFPSVRNGLSRSEHQIVTVLADGPVPLVHAFHRAHHQSEAAVFLGDAVFAMYLERLSGPDDPLLLFDDGTRVRVPQTPDEHVGFWKRSIVPTELSSAVARGDVDWVERAGIDRWLGGVHLAGREVGWRWDDDAHCLRVAESDA